MEPHCWRRGWCGNRFDRSSWPFEGKAGCARSHAIALLARGAWPCHAAMCGEPYGCATARRHCRSASQRICRKAGNRELGVQWGMMYALSGSEKAAHANLCNYLVQKAVAKAMHLVRSSAL